jgi:uncharacterized protein (TIGR02611 family)
VEPPAPERETVVDQAPKDWAEDKVDRAEGVLDDHGRVFRWMWVAVGFIVVAAGLAMIVFPGPVTVVVPIGLAMLAAVFGWARRLLLRSVELGDEATTRFGRAPTIVKVLTFAASACVAAAVIAWMIL